MGKLIYGTQTGTTDEIAERLKKALPELVQEIKPVFRASEADFDENFLILGGSTWGDGELTDDWADFFPQLDSIDFKGKTVALFGLGDQYGYGYNFVSAMKLLYDKVLERGGAIVGNTVPLEGFEFDHSESIVEDHFIGLVLDEVNQPELSDDRIEIWAEMVRNQLLSQVS